MKCRRIKAVFEDYLISEPLSQFFDPVCKLVNATSVYEAFQFLKSETKEIFYSVHLDSSNKVICVDLVAVGSLNQTIVHPREVFKTALLSSAAAIIFVHNHPSGNTNPSKEDIDITQRLISAGELLGIRVLDHIIIGDGFHSMADNGIL